MTNEHGVDGYDCAIVGGGLAGLTLACAFGGSGLRTALVEARPFQDMDDAAYDGRTTAIAYASVAFLAAAGLWDEDALEAQPIEDIVVLDGRRAAGRSPARRAGGQVRFSAADNGDGRPLGWIVENRLLRRRLATLLKSLDAVDVIAPRRVDGFEGSGARAELTLDDGRVVSAPLVVAADGAKSPLRRAAGVDALEWRYRQTALTATIAHERDHDGLAQELFLPAGPFAALPMRDRRTSIVWTECAKAAPAYEALSDGAFLQEIDARLGGCLGRLELAGPRGAYPLTLMAAKRFFGPRLALISEAAHRIHPIAGQGLNVGFRDVASLHELVVEGMKRGADIGAPDLLAAFDRWRRFDVMALAAATDALNRLFSNDEPLVRAARGLGLAAVQAAGPVRRLFMREAAGAVGLLPRMLDVE